VIHICYGLYDKDGRYSKFAGTSIVSVLENLPLPPLRQVTFHILHDNTLTDDNRDKFNYLVGSYGQQIKFYNVEKLCAEQLADFKKIFPAIDAARFTIGAMYRLLIADLLDANIHKVIYMDSDILVNLDISELWNIDLQDKPLAAVAESQADPRGFPSVSKSHYLINAELVSYENYFNSAVLLLNLERLRQERDNLNSAVKFISKTECFCFDQDVLNYCFANEYLHLDAKFDQFVARSVERADKISPRRVIYHYTGADPTFDFGDKLNKLYFSYFVKTTWFDLQMLENISEGVKKNYNDGKSFALKMSKVVSGKRRLFMTTSVNLKAVIKIFALEAGEEIILADKPGALNVLFEKLQGGDKILFVVLPNYQQVKNILVQRGFEEDRDFIDGTNFLTTTQGKSFNSYSLVKTL